jgi:diguanylate cyclase (GGDEF)-like protein/PAS domain S-box-containing protein
MSQLHAWARGSALDRTRFVFWVFAVFTTALAVPMLLFASRADGTARAAGGLAIAWMALRHIAVHRSARLAPALLGVDGAALLAIAAALGPDLSLGVFYVGVYFRSLYGERLQVSANALVFLAAYCSGSAIAGMSNLDDAVSQSYGILISAAVMRVVTVALQREERTRARERLLREAGAELVAARGAEAIAQAGVAAALRAVPDRFSTRVVLWRDTGDGYRAVAATGDGATKLVGTVVTTDVLSAGHVDAIRSGEPIRLDPGERGADDPKMPYEMKTGGVLIVPLQTNRGAIGVMVTSSDQPLPAEIDDTLLALASQVGLALEGDQLTADLHRRQSEERFGELIRNASDVITVVRADGTVEYQTASITAVLGYDPEALLGRPITELIHPDDVPASVAFLARARGLHGATATCEWRMAHRDGVWRHVEVVAGTLADDGAVRGIVLTSRDITERKALERRLAHQAFHDSLTGLANRELFRDRVEHALERTGRDGTAAVLFIDIDDFKNVNDTLGHAAGDLMLTLVAQRLRSCVRRGDTAARLGGDEFAVLLEDLTSPHDAERSAAAVLAALEGPLPLGDRHVAVRASIGIAFADHAIAAGEELLRNADIAMYAAKAEGKHRARVFEGSMYAEAVERVQLRDALAQAVARNELELHYQPIVDLRSGRVAGAEALIRWTHPERGMLMPGDFIALAEDSGLILPIGRWVIREACRQLRAWRDESAAADHLKISVNLSPGQLVEPRLIRDVADALRDHDLEPGSLLIEITESAVMDDVDVGMARLHGLAELGVGLALDDFGTGYSSLSHLQRFPLDVLKLDRSFTEQLRTDGRESRLARAIIEMGHTLGLTVVAEGVEEQAQGERLRNIGCALAQGFHFARPAPAALFLGVVAELGDGCKGAAAA